MAGIKTLYSLSQLAFMTSLRSGHCEYYFMGKERERQDDLFKSAGQQRAELGIELEAV